MHRRETELDFADGYSPERDWVEGGVRVYGGARGNHYAADSAASVGCQCGAVMRPGRAQSAAPVPTRLWVCRFCGRCADRAVGCEGDYL